MRFYLPETGESLDFTVPASYPYSQKRKKVQVLDRTAAGIHQVETFFVDTNTLTINFSDMPDADYQALLNWFVNVVNGMEKEFRMTDDLGDVRMVRFVSPEINGKLAGYDLWDVSFPLEEVEEQVP